MIRLNCFMEVSANDYDAVLSEAVALTEESRKQSGCIDYDIFTSATRQGVMMFCETWKDQAALDAHMASDIFKKCVGEIEKTTKLHINQFTL